MKEKNIFSGVIPAIITPLDENKKLDKAAQKKIIDHLMDCGCNGVMILGTVGEGMDVGSSVASETMKSAVNIMNGRGVVIAGTSNCVYEENMQNILHAAETGIDAVLNVPPFYHKFSQQVIFDYYTRLADESPLPVMIYNMPDLVKVSVDFQTVVRLREHKNIVGIKDSSGNAVYLQQLCSLCCKNFSVFCGRAPLSAIAFLLGASGTMTPLANLVPLADLTLMDLVSKGKNYEARDLMLDLGQIITLFNAGVDPISKNIKAILSKKQICQPYTAGFIPYATANEIEKIHGQYDEIVKKFALQKLVSMR